MARRGNGSWAGTHGRAVASNPGAGQPLRGLPHHGACPTGPDGLDPFPRDGYRGVFESGQVRIESHDGAVISSRAHPRAAFFGRSGLRRNIRWDPLDSVYFAGYAMWNYLTTPYLLTREGVAVEEGAPWQQEGETWRRLIVSFPPDIDTHSPRQTFYVDASGLLRRHDYVPEVVGHWARAAHYCADPVDVDGFVFPTCRWVHPIGPGIAHCPSQLWYRSC